MRYRSGIRTADGEGLADIVSAGTTKSERSGTVRTWSPRDLNNRRNKVEQINEQERMAYTINEAAKIMSISRRHLIDLIESGRIEVKDVSNGNKIRKHLRITRKAINESLQPETIGA